VVTTAPAEEVPPPQLPPQTAPVPPEQLSPAPTIAPPTTPAGTGGEHGYQKNKPAANEQQQAPKRAARPATPPPAQGPPASTPVPSSPPPSESPRLGEILTPEQQRQLNAAIDQSLAHANSSLGSISNRQLNNEQQATMKQVQGFMQQAQETRKADLAAAKSLAERAEVLANDLVASLR